MNEACANIGPQQRQLRLIGGIAGLTLAVVLLAGLQLAAVQPAWRFLLFPLVWLSLLGIQQARERTCVALAIAGKRNLDHGTESISGDEIDQRLRRQALWLTVRATLAALVLTLLAVTAPF